MENENLIRIILVDDDEDDCDLFKEAIIESGLPLIVKALCHGEDLLTELSSTFGELPNVIFLDINMPRKDGLEVLDEIRKSKKLKRIPVIMFSTSIAKRDIESTYEHGANLYIRKDLFFSQAQTILKTLFTDEGRKYLTKIPKDMFVLRADMFSGDL